MFWSWVSFPSTNRLRSSIVISFCENPRHDSRRPRGSHSESIQASGLSWKSFSTEMEVFTPSLPLWRKCFHTCGQKICLSDKFYLGEAQHRANYTVSYCSFQEKKRHFGKEGMMVMSASQCQGVHQPARATSSPDGSNTGRTSLVDSNRDFTFTYQ